MTREEYTAIEKRYGMVYKNRGNNFSDKSSEQFPASNKCWP